MIDTRKYVFVFIAVTFVAYFLFYKYMKQETQRAFEDYTEDGPAWNDEKVIKAMEESVVQWSQAIHSLQNHGWETAAKLYRQGREAIATYHDRYGNREVLSKAPASS